MSSRDAWLQAGPVAELLPEIADAIAMQYNIEAESAEEIVREVFAASLPLKQAAEKEPAASKLRRTRAFKDAVAEGKRRVYYHLRRYLAKQGDFQSLVEQLERLAPGASPEERDRLVATLVRQHKSTQERLPDLAQFHDQLFEHLGPFRNVLDVGCGVYPLVFPFERAEDQLSRYVAADKDPMAIRAIEAYAKARGDGRIVAAPWNVESGWGEILGAGTNEGFDVALMLKLVPVVQRQHRDALPLLAQCPARLWVVSASRTSMTKREDIERRERASLRRFAELAGRRVRADFQAGNEFVWILETTDR